MLKVFPLAAYFLSFSPLWIAILFIDIKNLVIHTQHYSTECISIFLIILGIIVSSDILLRNLQEARNSDQEEIEITEVREKKAITAEYTITYVLPLLAFNMTLWDQVVLFLIFFIPLGIICYTHNYIVLSVVFGLARYHIYDCTYIDSSKVKMNKIIISKQSLNTKQGQKIKIYHLNDDIAIDQFKTSKNATTPGTK